MVDKRDDRKRVVVDVCCGPCSIPLEDIYSGSREYDILFFITDHNVHPHEEYLRRLKSIKKVAEHYNNEVFIAPYLPEEWFASIAGLENDVEGGARCIECYRYRLEKAALFAKEHDCEYFTTTLTTGPSKEAEIINKLGDEIARHHGIKFIKHDLKKNNGFLRSVQKSKELELYRQDYCGCIYSMRS